MSNKQPEEEDRDQRPEEEPTRQASAEEEEAGKPEEEEMDEQPSPFRFRRLDGHDPMKYEDVADK